MLQPPVGPLMHFGRAYRMVMTSFCYLLTVLARGIATAAARAFGVSAAVAREAAKSD